MVLFPSFHAVLTFPALYTHVRTYTCTYIYTYLFVYIYVHIRMRIFIKYVCMMYVYVLSLLYMCIRINCMYACSHITDSLTVLQENNITHILSVHDEAKPVFKVCTYAHICMYVRTYVHICTHVCTYMYVCMSVCMCLCSGICEPLCPSMYACSVYVTHTKNGTCVVTSFSTCAYTYIFADVFVYKCLCLLFVCWCLCLRC